MRGAITPNYKLGTFSTAGCPPFTGVLLDDERVVALHGLPGLTGTETMVGFLRNWPSNRAALREAVAAIRSAELKIASAPLDSLRVHAPLAPGSIICAAANYRKHVLEWYEKEPEVQAQWAERLTARAASDLSFLFCKNVSAVTDPDAEIEIPFDTSLIDWEVEIAVVIGREARRVARENALDYVAGYTVANDFSARDFLSRDDVNPGLFDFFGSKSSPGFCPLGPFILPAEFVPDPQAMHLRLSLNGQVMQDEGSDDMIDSVAKLIAFASSRMILKPGDVIMTGSPQGNAKKYNRFLQPGDVVEAEVVGIGKQVVRFVAEGRV